MKKTIYARGIDDFMEWQVNVPESLDEALTWFKEEGVLHLLSLGIQLSYRDKAEELLGEGHTQEEILKLFASGQWSPLMETKAEMLFRHYQALPPDQRQLFDELQLDLIRQEKGDRT